MKVPSHAAISPVEHGCVRRGRFAIIIGVLIFGLVSAVPGNSLRGETVTVPPGLENMDGINGILFPFDTGSSDVDFTRLQQLYTALELPTVLPGIRITEIAFRADGDVERLGRSFDTIIPGVEIRMSTTSRTPASFTGNFAANIGGDENIAFPTAPVRWATTWVPGQANPFNLRFPLSTPYDYYPARGNLLLDISVFGKVRTDGLDAHPFSGAVAWAIAPGDTDQILRNGGIVAQLTFEAIPEPRTWMLLIVASCGLGVRAALRRT